jgi:hypothetical protein
MSKAINVTVTVIGTGTITVGLQICSSITVGTINVTAIGYITVAVVTTVTGAVARTVVSAVGTVAFCGILIKC